MTYTIKGKMYEIKSSTYPSDYKIIKRISTNEKFGILIYINSLIDTPENYTEIDKPEELTEELQIPGE